MCVSLITKLVFKFHKVFNAYRTLNKISNLYACFPRNETCSQNGSTTK